MADNSTKPDGFSFLASIIAVLVTIAVFAVIVLMAYGLGGNKEAAAVAGETPKYPSGATLKAQDDEVLSTYGWVDQDNSVVRIPVDVAQELLIQELNK